MATTNEEFGSQAPDTGDESIEFQQSQDDLEAISSGLSKVVPNVKYKGTTAFTIVNAPTPKSLKF
jgi:hypothetical protein